ncbi:putative adenosine deaminase [Phyllosticta citribraziliensis]|uniref:Adenosine deaminase n=1 Tax=Phyllosticta citribraziliensis TaxID=989973 RepID=A0ABR1LI09_9PEZI
MANATADDKLSSFITAMPKLDLHVHIEGTLTPELRWDLATKHRIPLPFSTASALRASYNHLYATLRADGSNALPVFLSHYYGGMDVLRDEADFYALATHFLRACAAAHVRYVEPFFDVQAHTRRGVPAAAVLDGLLRAKRDMASSVGCNFVLCFLRDEPAAAADAAYAVCAPYAHRLFVGVGIDSDERGNPPAKFDDVFRRARADGLKVTAHCDVNQVNGHAHISQAVSEVGGGGLDRIDHGVNAGESPELIAAIRARGLGLTLCPQAYVIAKEARWGQWVRALVDEGVKVTIGSDDPAYMHGMGTAENMVLAAEACKLDTDEVVLLVRNAIDICWADADVKKNLESELDKFVKEWEG